jgi:hypothetical protein
MKRRKKSGFLPWQVTDELESGELNQDECLIVQAREINMSKALGIKYPSIPCCRAGGWKLLCCSYP